MRTAALPALLLLVLLLPAPTGAQAIGDLRITEILPNPEPALGQREFIELANIGSAALNLAGWRLRDAPTASNSTNDYTFPALVLDPGQRVVVWSNGTPGWGLAWSTSASKAVWNDGGDSATLLDPDGITKDWVGYGTLTQGPPPGFAKSATPARGKSLQFVNGTWAVDTPTPGLAPGQQGGTVVGQVANVAPTVVLHAPATAAARATISIRIEASDGNGDSDVVSWSLSSSGKVLRNGTGAPTGNLSLTAPSTPGDWMLVADVRDAAGVSTLANATVQISAPKLTVKLPPGGALRFPGLKPGDQNVTSLDAFTLSNDGNHAAIPLLDISPFRASAAQIGVDGNLWLGVTQAGATTWVHYTGALEPLPSLAAGASATVHLRIGQVPIPTPAGAYGTTFTVVPA